MTKNKMIAVLLGAALTTSAFAMPGSERNGPNGSIGPKDNAPSFGSKASGVDLARDHGQDDGHDRVDGSHIKSKVAQAVVKSKVSDKVEDGRSDSERGDRIESSAQASDHGRSKGPSVEGPEHGRSKGPSASAHRSGR